MAFHSPFTGRGDREAVGGGFGGSPPSVISLALDASFPVNGEGEVWTESPVAEAFA